MVETQEKSSETENQAEKPEAVEEKRTGWLKGAAWQTWGIIKNTASQITDTVASVTDTVVSVSDKVTDKALDTWSKLSGDIWTKSNVDGSVSKVGIIDKSLVIPPIDQFNWGWSADSLWSLGKDSKEKSWAEFTWDWDIRSQDGTTKTESANGTDRTRERNDSPPEHSIEGSARHGDDWRRDSGENHVVRDAQGNFLCELSVKDGRVFRKDAAGAETEATLEFVRHQTSDGQKLIINKRTGEVFYESGDGTVNHSRNGERFRHIDKRRGVICDGDGKTLYMVQRDENRRITIDKVMETVEMVEERGKDSTARLNRDRERLAYTIEHLGRQFQFLQDKLGNQYYKDEEGTQYWRSVDGKQTVKTVDGGIYRQDKGLRIYRSPDGREHFIDADGKVSIYGGALAGEIIKDSDGTLKLSDGTAVNTNGDLVLTDGTKIDREGTVYSAGGHRAERSGRAIFRDGQAIDRKGFCHRDGTKVSQAGDVEIKHKDGTTTDFQMVTKGLSLADGTKIDDKGTTTNEGTRINVDRSVVVSDGTRINADYSISFADGTEITPDGRITASDGWASDANYYHNGIEFTSQAAAQEAAAAAVDLVHALMGRISDGTVTFNDINNLRAALCDLGILSRAFTQQGNLGVVAALGQASGEVQLALSKAIPKAQSTELGRQRQAQAA